MVRFKKPWLDWRKMPKVFPVKAQNEILGSMKDPTP
jgi:hypothetical protein